MRELKYIIVGSIIILGIEGMFFFGPWKKSNVLSEKVAATVVPTIAPTPTITPTPSPTLKPTPKPTIKPTPTPTPVTSQQINEFIDKYSGQYSLDPNFIRHVALCESGFNPNAIDGPYIGLFQFDALTWKNIRKELGKSTDANLRYSAEESVITATYALSKGRHSLWPHCAI